MSLVVLFSILFPAVHSYEHTFEQHSGKQKTEIKSINKNDFKVSNHVTEKCSICDFKFCTFAVNSLTPFEFNDSNTEIYFTSFFYFKTFSTFFKGSLFALRAPPVN